MRKIQNWLWIWVFWAFLLGGCSKAIGTYDDQSPGASQDAESPAVVPSSEVSVTELAGDSLPADLVTEPSFSTKGYVFARESYTNNSSRPVHLWPSSRPSLLVLKTQFTGQANGVSLNSYMTTLALSLAVTSNQNPAVMERLTDSVLGSSVTLAAGEKVILNWRVGPAAGSELCVFQVNTTGQVMGNPISLTTVVNGSELDLSFQRSVQLGDDPEHLQEVLPSESPNIHSATGILTPQYTPSLVCNGVYVNLMGTQ